VTSRAWAALPKFAATSGVSGIAWERRQTSRTPAGPVSSASERENASTAAQAGPAPPSRRAGRHPPGNGSQSQDRTGALAAHAPGRGGRGDEVRARVEGDRAGEVVGGQLGQRPAARGRPGADRVERDVDASRPLDHGVEVLLHGPLVQCVDLRRLRDAAGGDDRLGDGIHLRRIPAGQEEPGALASERAGDCGADRASGGVDHGGLVLEQHLRPPFVVVLVETPPPPGTDRPIRFAGNWCRYR
jgi:hypothetical protein